METPFIHIHIPKTAGTSLRAAFIDSYGPEKVAFMLPEKKFVKTSDLAFGTKELDALRRTAREQRLLPQFSTMVQRMNRNSYYPTFSLEDVTTNGIMVATGHIKHTDIPDTATNLAITTIIRDPLERAWSHYAHWVEAQGKMWWHDGQIDFDDTATFEEFASDPLLHNYQAKFIGSFSCAVLGTTSGLRTFLERVGIASPPSLDHLNSGLYNELPAIDAGFLREFIKNNELDYELYEKARTT